MADCEQARVICPQKNYTFLTPECLVKSRGDYARYYVAGDDPRHDAAPQVILPQK